MEMRHLYFDFERVEITWCGFALTVLPCGVRASEHLEEPFYMNKSKPENLPALVTTSLDVNQ